MKKAVEALTPAWFTPPQREGAGLIGERQVDQAKLFYEFSLDGQVPQDHLLRAIEALCAPHRAALPATLEPDFFITIDPLRPFL